MMDPPFSRRHWLVRYGAIPLLGCWLLLTPLYDEVRPVLKSFHVTDAHWVPGGLEVWGVMQKQRKCTIEQFYAIAYFRGDTPRRPIRIRTPASDEEGEEDPLLSRLTGKSAFGPWFIPVTSDVLAVNIYTGHNCWWYRLTEVEMPIWRRGS